MINLTVQSPFQTEPVLKFTRYGNTAVVKLAQNDCSLVLPDLPAVADSKLWFLRLSELAGGGLVKFAL